eukprot:768767-Hanusia_phi.AAC.4
MQDLPLAPPSPSLMHHAHPSLRKHADSLDSCRQDTSSSDPPDGWAGRRYFKHATAGARTRIMAVLFNMPVNIAGIRRGEVTSCAIRSLHRAA